MQPGPGSGQDRDVAVGPDRVVAAQVFGPLFDDAHVTTYDDFRAEVVPGSIRSLGLVCGPETAELIAGIFAATPHPERILIGLPGDATSTDELHRTILADPDLRPAELLRTAGTIVVRLAPADEVTGAEAKRLLAGLPAPASRRGLLGRLLSRLSDPSQRR